MAPQQNICICIADLAPHRVSDIDRFELVGGAGGDADVAGNARPWQGIVIDKVVADDVDDAAGIGLQTGCRVPRDCALQRAIGFWL